KSGGIPNDGASDLVWESMMGDGNGSEWEVRVVILVVVIVSGIVVEKESEAVVMTIGKVVMVE
ncbi:hypothetical protein Tco_1139402, partial [Tanacetum coccineum]